MIYLRMLNFCFSKFRKRKLGKMDEEVFSGYKIRFFITYVMRSKEKGFPAFEYIWVLLRNKGLY